MLLLFLLYIQLGKRKMNLIRFIIPIGAIFLFGKKYIHSIPTDGANLTILLLTIVIGALMGILLVSFTSVVKEEDDFYTIAGIPYAIILIISIGSRSAFSYYVQHNQVSFGQFLMKHQIDSTIIAPAFITMVFTMLLIRMAGILIKVNRLRKKNQLAEKTD